MTSEAMTPGDALARRNGVFDPKFKRAWEILAEAELLTEALFGEEADG